MDCSTRVVGTDAHVLYQTAHQRDASTAILTRHLTGYLPDPGVDHADVEAVDDRGRPQRDGAIGSIPVAVFDCVGDGLAGGDEHVLDLFRLDTRFAQPTSQSITARGQVLGVRGEVDLQRGRL